MADLKIGIDADSTEGLLLGAQLVPLDEASTRLRRPLFEIEDEIRIGDRNAFVLGPWPPFRLLIPPVVVAGILDGEPWWVTTGGVATSPGRQPDSSTPLLNRSHLRVFVVAVEAVARKGRNDDEKSLCRAYAEGCLAHNPKVTMAAVVSELAKKHPMFVEATLRSWIRDLPFDRAPGRRAAGK